MKFILATLALVAGVIAGSHPEGSSGKKCFSGQTVVCKDNGKGGLLSLGNIAPGALGVDCSGGDVYCCDDKDVAVRNLSMLPQFDRILTSIQSGLVNLDVNAQCSLNHVL